MARITIEDCLSHVGNRFELVLLATGRARKLLTGEADPLVEWGNDKVTVVALREIAGGLLDRAGEAVSAAVETVAVTTHTIPAAVASLLNAPVTFFDHSKDDANDETH